MPCSFPSAGSNGKAFSFSAKKLRGESHKGKKERRAPERERERHGRRNDTLMTGTMNLFFFFFFFYHLTLPSSFFHLLVRCPSSSILPPSASKGIDNPSSHGEKKKVKSQRRKANHKMLRVVDGGIFI